MATSVSSGSMFSAGDPMLNHPSPSEQPSANPTARPSLSPQPRHQHRPPGWQENPFPSMDQPLPPRRRVGGSREGCEEERDPVNKPRLNRLLGAVQAQPH